MDADQNTPSRRRRHHQQHHHMSHVDRTFGQWGFQETKDFLVIRAEVDTVFLENKRDNELHWKMVATRMKENGYVRTPQQCRAKWKTLVYQYKECEKPEVQDTMRQQFPFYKEMQDIYNARMQRMLWLEAYQGPTQSSASKNKFETLFSSDEEEYKGQDETTSHQEDHNKSSAKKKRRVMRKEGKTTPANTTLNRDTEIVNAFKKMMEDFGKRHKAEEMQLMREYEEREERRRVREMEWRQEMKALEKERLMMERSFGERDEQMRLMNESKAVQREALMNALLNKLSEE